MERESKRRSLVLAASAIAPVALVALWLVFSGTEEAPTGSLSGRSEVARTPGDAPRPSTSERSERRRFDESQGAGLAELAERRQALLKQRAASDWARGSSDSDGYDEDSWDDGGERSLGIPDGRDGPTPEQYEELQRQTLLEMPSEAELTALMQDEPPMPTPEEVVDLRERTSALLDFPPDQVEAVRQESESKRPSAERMAILEARLDEERAARLKPQQQP